MGSYTCGAIVYLFKENGYEGDAIKDAGKTVHNNQQS
jgi:hypothetical protein